MLKRKRKKKRDGEFSPRYGYWPCYILACAAVGVTVRGMWSRGGGGEGSDPERRRD